MDPFALHPSLLDSPASRAVAVTPSDSTNLTEVSRGLWIGGGGSISVVMLGGGTVSFTGIAAGTLLPIRVSRVNQTGTTATGIVSLS